MISDKQRRAAMAGHIGDIGLAALRGGDERTGEIALDSACEIANDRGNVLVEYRSTLEAFRFTTAQIDAAVAAIDAGKHPDGSLPAKLATMRENALSGQVDSFDRGEAHAYENALRLLGCPVVPLDTVLEANRILVLEHLDAGNESTTEHITKVTGVPAIDLIVILNDEARAKRIECVGASRLWRRPAGYVKP